MDQPAGKYRTLQQLWRHDIWQPGATADHPIRGRCYALLRVASITWTGLVENHLTSRAAALSYASLLGLGPLVAIAMLVAGFALNQDDPAIAVRTLNGVIKFIAPQVAQYDQLTATPQVVQLLNSFIANSRSGAAGALGGLTLIIIVIQLFTSVENAFNAVWGVRRGRSWLTRIVFYWTILTLGTVLFFVSLTSLSAAAFVNVFVERLPFGDALLKGLVVMLPGFSALMVIVILSVFYRYIPNTRVLWRAAFFGAIVVAAVLFLNNYLAFLYFKRVLMQQSLYGSLGLLPILMFGMYIFWFVVLVGGQISYAVQNVHYRSSQIAWNNLSETVREGLSLLVLLLICRRFKDCQPAFSPSELGRRIKVPTQILNESLNRLVDLGLIAAIPPAEGQASLDYHYQPSRPLGRMTLLEFKQRFEAYGENPSGAALDEVDPVLRMYHERLACHVREALGTTPLDGLLDELPAPAAAAL
ncbi:MAG TPA: YihY/virulence factor BrkB family protein [Opitutaceae bacterium]|nr:YihY/virulence factor BrkB family protein [Opitutaceae bacterium]